MQVICELSKISCKRKLAFERKETFYICLSTFQLKRLRAINSLWD